MGSARKGGRAWSPVSLCFRCKCVRNISLGKDPPSHDQLCKHCPSSRRLKVPSQVSRASVRGQQNSFLHSLNMPGFLDKRLSAVYCLPQAHHCWCSEKSQQGMPFFDRPHLRGVAFIRSVRLNNTRYRNQTQLRVNSIFAAHKFWLLYLLICHKLSFLVCKRSLEISTPEDRGAWTQNPGKKRFSASVINYRTRQ